MFPRFPPLHHTVFIAACWVGMSVLVILWHFELTGNEVLGNKNRISRITTLKFESVILLCNG